MDGTGQLLVAFTCALEMVYQFSHFVFFYNVTIGSTFLDFNLCVKIQSASAAAFSAIQIVLPIIAADRLFGTAFPFMYVQKILI